MTATVNRSQFGRIVRRNISFAKAEGARKDVRAVRLKVGREILRGYTLIGGESIYASLVNARGQIIGWEHSFCHEPVALVLEEGVFNNMPAGVRAELKYGKNYRAVYAELDRSNASVGVVPGGKLLAFIPVSTIE